MGEVAEPAAHYSYAGSERISLSLLIMREMLPRWSWVLPRRSTNQDGICVGEMTLREVKASTVYYAESRKDLAVAK